MIMVDRKVNGVTVLIEREVVLIMVVVDSMDSVVSIVGKETVAMVIVMVNNKYRKRYHIG